MPTDALTAPVARDPNAIVIDGVSKTYRTGKREVNALVDVNLTIGRGDFVTLFGASGCGKSTLLRIIAGLEDRTGGEISLFYQTPAEASQRKNIAWVPQSSALLPWLTIRDNTRLSEVVNRTADRTGHSERQPEDAALVLTQLGLGEFLNSFPSQLSGGMRQRAAIARGFVQGAPLMLMDEPFSALDEITRDTLRLRLLDVWERNRKTVIFVTHSAAEAVMLSDRVVVMTPRPGRISAVIDIDLPRPRPADIAESPRFGTLVKEVKRVLRTSWEADE